MKTVAIFFNDPNADGYPLVEEEYITSYRELDAECARQGIRMVMVRAQESYLGGNSFNGCWEFTESSLKHTPSTVTADVIYNKGDLVSDAAARVINPLSLDALCTDKSKSYARFPLHSPKTWTIRNSDELSRACAAIPGDLAVAKPLHLHGGKGVMIAPPADIQASVQSFPYLVQEYIDTSNGIPGITPGRHDFRIVSICGDIIQVYVRTPPEHGHIANLSHGATLHMLTPSNVPNGALELFRAIDAELSVYPERVYCTDMGLNRDGQWMLIELNSKPGLRWRKHGDSAALFQERLVELFVHAASGDKQPVQ